MDVEAAALPRWLGPRITTNERSEIPVLEEATRVWLLAVEIRVEARLVTREKLPYCDLVDRNFPQYFELGEDLDGPTEW
jgi:hypothetical protein